MGEPQDPLWPCGGPASGERGDEALLLLLMQAPRSFTGEDVVEVHCHGGLICVQRVHGKL